MTTDSEEKIMERCTKCILPSNYPGITFNEKGVCHHCIIHKERTYLGQEALVKDIKDFLKTKKDRNKKYDCVVGASGGRDSNYLLYTLTKKLNLNVLAFSSDNGIFIPDQANENMKNAANILDIKLVIKKNDLLKKCVKHTVSSWMRRPSLEMVETFCSGCRHPIVKGMIDFAKQENVPVIIRGATPFELTQYKFNLMRIKRRPEYKTLMMKTNPKASNNPLIFGYLSNVINNPKWLFNFNYLSTQFKDYYYFFNEHKITEKSGLIKIRPFFTHMRWVEKDVVSTIKNKLGWKKHSDSGSTWRGDCDIAFLKLYVYQNMLGFNDKIDSLSHLIRDKQITRDEAMKRFEKEVMIPDEAMEEIFKRIGLKFSDFKNALRKLQKRG